jgi:hypothetical protein
MFENSWSESPKERENLADLDVNYRNIEMDLKETRCQDVEWIVLT